MERGEALEHVGTRVPPAVLSAVDRVAARERRTRAQLLRIAVEELLERRGELSPLTSVVGS